MKKIISVFFAIAAVVSLTACNTVQGIGKDIEKGGEAIQKATK
jgi:entericidin B